VAERLQTHWKIQDVQRQVIARRIICDSTREEPTALRGPQKIRIGGATLPAAVRSGGRKQAFVDQPFAELDPVFVIDVKQDDGGATYRSAADEVSALPAETLRPFMPAGIEKRLKPARLRVSAAEIASFKRITIITTQT
jgi:hypothetical protein